MEAEQSESQTVERAVKTIIDTFDKEPSRDGIVDTPARVARMYKELLTPKEFTFTTFDANGYDEMILSKDISFYTLCEHHMLPFFGTVTIGYIPGKTICGLSKLARTVEYYSRGLNTQEYMTQSIANFLQDRLYANGLGVLIRGRHLCQEMRGIQKRSDMVTSCLKGVFLTEQKAREEFLLICQQP